jgi:hypothetical protein
MIYILVRVNSLRISSFCILGTIINGPYVG